MAPLKDRQIDEIAQRLLHQIGGSSSLAPAPPQACGQTPRSDGQREARRAGPDSGVSDFGVGAAVEAATEAFHHYQQTSLETRYEIIAGIRRAALAHAESLAQEAHRETGLGRWEDKLVKNQLVAKKTPGPESLDPTVTTGDRGLTLMERAPYGVIGSITPSTNPTSTIICNAIGMLAAGNAVVFNVHPMAAKVCQHTVRLLNEAIVGAGGPANLVTSVAEPTIKSAQALMSHLGVRLLVVTGGPGVVQAAMSSDKRAICAGPGNPPVVVDETANIPKAARDVVRGAAFDNNVICTDEKEALVVDAVADELLAEMQKHGAIVLNDSQTKQIENVIFQERREAPQSSVVDRQLIGKNAAYILNKINLNVDDSVRLIVVDVPRNHPLVWTEQLMPVFPVVRVADVNQAIDLAVAAEGGRRHTAAMHSHNINSLSRMARLIDCSIFVKNAPCYAGLGEGGEGYTSFSIASPTGEGMTGPVSFSRLRRCVLVDHLRIV